MNNEEGQQENKVNINYEDLEDDNLHIWAAEEGSNDNEDVAVNMTDDDVRQLAS